MDTDFKDIEAQLAALADGTLPDEQRAPLLERLQAEPRLAEELERQRHALAIVGSVAQVRAPQSLHSSIEAIAASTPSRASRRLPLRARRSIGGRLRIRGRLRLAAAGALTAAAVAIAVALTASTASEPTVAQAATLALRPATLPAPPPSRSHSNVLSRSVEGIAYPYWQDSFGWRASGARTDRLDGRAITTVFYMPVNAASGMPRIGYAIVAGRALSIPRGASIDVRGVRFHLIASHGSRIVTWRRAGHTCILVSQGVPAATLVRLAAWG